ncbi:MAG TPA: Gfo/Idh/MocA family oxidoreductase [Streptosporangiaceae bacterium]|nr:Gfo/Idh/MocA family oxidoreductase [Streptosporangiaceae bacterium]
MASAPLRFGLVGTGYWASITHAPALAAAPDIELAAVWGRSAEAAAALAGLYGAQSFSGAGDLDAFLDGVDGVAFAVPPDVQAPIAVAAARAGKHLMLEKPLATSVAGTDELALAVAEADVASVVFFTLMFRADIRAWLAEVTARGGWLGGLTAWFGSSLEESSPFNTPWRQEKGALWDIAPHAVSLLWAALGPVTGVTADAGPADVSHLILHHEGGASSTVTVSQHGGEAASGFETFLWGPSGRSAVPGGNSDALAPLGTALSELVASIRSGRSAHPCDASFGRDVGHVISEAQRQIDERAG